MCAWRATGNTLFNRVDKTSYAAASATSASNESVVGIKGYIEIYFAILRSYNGVFRDINAPCDIEVSTHAIPIRSRRFKLKYQYCVGHYRSGNLNKNQNKLVGEGYNTVIIIRMWSWFSKWSSLKAQAPVPLTVFRSNLTFDQNLECSSLKCVLPITTKFCTRHDSVTVVTCAKFHCDRLSIFQTRALQILVEFQIRSKYR